MSSSKSQIYLVVGASRGVGKGLVEQLSSDPSHRVIATVRKQVDFQKSNVETLILDQTDAESVRAAASKVAEADVLIVNAAIGDDEKLLGTSEDRLQQYLNTNVVGVHRVVAAFLPALQARQTRKLVIISSTSGSLEKQFGASFGFMGPYAVTKAANNMQVVQYHNELSKEGYTVIALHPGWVATDMGNIAGDGAMPIAQSASDIVKVVTSLKHEDSGRFFSHDGSFLPW